MIAPAPLRLRPLEVGDVLDETFRLYRRHFLVLAAVSVGFAIPLAALAGYGFWTLFSGVFNQAASGQAADLSQWGGLFVALGLGSLVYLALQPLEFGALTYVVCESALGHRVTVSDMMRSAFRRYFHVLGFVGLAFLMTLFWCLFPLWIWILVNWVAVLPAMFIENLGLGAAMSRSWRLVEGRWWRTFFILVLVYILTNVVSVALGGFMYLGQALLSIFLSPYLALSVYEAAVIVVDGLITPILIIAIVLIYFDLRVRREGIDLFQLASRISAPPPVPA